MSKYFIILFFLFFFLHPSYCRQLQSDSIFRVLKKSAVDSVKIKELAAYTNKLASYNPQEAVKLALLLVDVSQEINYKTGVASAYNELGHAYERHSANDSAFSYFFISSHLFSAINDLPGKAEVFYNIGNLHEIMGRFDSSAFYIYQSLQIADSINSTDLKGKNNRILGNVMAKQNRLDEALQYYFSSLNLLQYTKKFPELIGRVQENIALVYITKKEFEKAESYFQKAINIYKENNETRGLARVNLNIANLRVAEGKYDEAIMNCLFALKFYRNINHLNGIAESLMQLSDAYFKKMDYDHSIDCALQTLEIVKKNMDKDIELSALRVLHKSYSAKGDARKAYEYLVKTTALNDSIFSDKKESIITELQTRYEVQKKETEIALLSKDKELNLVKSNKQKIFRNSLIAGIILLLIIVILAFNRYRSYQKNNRQKQLISISSDLHDEIGSTLSSISMYSSYAGQQLSENKTNEAKNVLEEISATSQEMIEDMNDIIWTINPRNDSFKSMVARLKNFASLITQSKFIQLHFFSDENLNSINLSTTLRKNIYLIVKEAINNAVKYSRCKNLTVRLEGNKKLLVAEIQDDGDGFDAVKLYDGNGLKNMQFRSEQIHASFLIKTSPGLGTTIYLKKKIR